MGLYVAAADTGQLRHLGVGLLLEGTDSHAKLRQHLRHNPFALIEQRVEQMLGLHLARTSALGGVLGGN